MLRKAKNWVGGCICFTFCIMFLSYADDSDEAFVTKVGEDYSFTLGNGKRARLIGITLPSPYKESPVNSRLFNQTVYTFTRQLLENKKVRLEYDTFKQDPSGTQFVYAYLLDGTFVNARLIEEGFAQAIPEPVNKKHLNSLLASEKKAKENNKGLWQINSYLKSDFSLMHGISLPRTSVLVRGLHNLKEGIHIGEDKTVVGIVRLKVQIENGNLKDIQIIENTYSHCQEIDRAFELLPKEMIRRQTLDVDAISGATISSSSIKYAVYDAILKAGK